MASGKSVLEILDDSGAQRLLASGLAVDCAYRERYSILPDDPLSAEAHCAWTQSFARGDWQLRTEAESTQWADRESFHLEARLRAYEGEEKVFDRRWTRSVPRENL